MADGSADITTEAEARRAAAEAAREAKAEALPKAAPGKPKRKSARPRKAAEWHEFLVDVWITDLNSVEFGFYKRSRNKAKSRQFTTDMDVFAEIIENGERTGLLGYREDLWKDNVGMDKRLVFKLFGEKLNWKATMDLMIARSMQLTLGARGVPVLAFSINGSDDDHMVYLERSANKWPLLPENFSFFSMDKGEPEFYRLKRDLIDLGGDYTLLNQRNEAIGTIDGRLLSFGKWYVSVKKEHADPAC